MHAQQAGQCWLTERTVEAEVQCTQTLASLQGVTNHAHPFLFQAIVAHVQLGQALTARQGTCKLLLAPIQLAQEVIRQPQCVQSRCDANEPSKTIAGFIKILTHLVVGEVKASQLCV